MSEETNCGIEPTVMENAHKSGGGVPPRTVIKGTLWMVLNP